MGSASSLMSAAPAPVPDLSPTPAHLQDHQTSSPPTASNNMTSQPAPTASSMLISPQPSSIPVDIVALRQAAMHSAQKQKRGSPSPALSAPPLAEEVHVPFASSSKTNQAPPSLPSLRSIASSSKATLSEREEGEISDDEEGQIDDIASRTAPAPPPRQQNVVQAKAGPIHPPSQKKGKKTGNTPKKPKSPPKARPSPPPPSQAVHQSVSPRVQAVSTQQHSPVVIDKGKGKEVAPEVEAAAPDITSAEAQQYMEIIRNLLREGFSPEILVRRGATPKFVTAVCEEIVQGTKKRKALWLETREPARESSETPSVAPTPPQPLPGSIKSPSPDIEVSINMERNPSVSSESSADIALVERMSIPTGSRQRLGSSSSSTPPLHRPPVVAPPRSTISTPHAIRIESYRPGPSFPKPIDPPSLDTASRDRPTPSSQGASLAARLGMTTLASASPLVAAPATSLAADPPFSASSKVVPTGPKRKKRAGRQLDDVMANGTDIVLDYGDEAGNPSPAAESSTRSLAGRMGQLVSYASEDTLSPASLPIAASVNRLPVAASLMQPKASPTIPTTTPAQIAQPVSAADSALQSLLLETRRKALESMRRRREMTSVSGGATPNAQLTAAETAELAVDDISIAQQADELEKEIMSLQAADRKESEEEEEAMDIDDDEPEEGEIFPSPPTESTPQLQPHPTAPSLYASSLPIAPPRGVKRAHAEDLMEGRPASLPIRAMPPVKRRPFGAPQRAQRLIFHLDDLSDSSDDEDEGFTTTPHSIAAPIIPDFEALQKERLLREKEESIKRLKEKIAAKMRENEKRKLEAAASASASASTSGSGAGTPMVKATTDTGSLDMVRAAVAHQNQEHDGDRSPLPAGVRELAEELVQEEAEVKLAQAEAKFEAKHIAEAEEANGGAMDVDLVPGAGVSADDPIIVDDDEPMKSTAVETNNRRRSVSPSVIQTASSSLLNGPMTTVSPDLPHAFKTYQPLLSRYPQLNHSSTADTSFAHLLASPLLPKSGLELLSEIDDELLNSIVLTNQLRRHPGVVVLTIIPLGGGDADEDLVEYVSQALPTADAMTINIALRKAKKKQLDPSAPAPAQAKGQGKNSMDVKGAAALLALVGQVLASDSSIPSEHGSHNLPPSANGS